MKLRLLLLSTLISISVQVFAQKVADTSKKVNVEIVTAGYIERVPTDSIAFNKLVNNVQLQQGETMMYCDSAYLYSETNNVEAFGNVVIIQPDGTRSASDYLKYIGNKKLAFLDGNVSLTDGKDNLWATEVQYDLNTKIGVYYNGGTLQSDATSLTSNSGVYNIRTKDARFTEDVHVYDPEYTIVSDDMGYNTETKITTFFASSVVTSDSSVLTTHCGTYDSKLQAAHFPCRSSILTKEQYMEADSLYYNKTNGQAKARGDVLAIDTTQKLTLYCQRADMNEKKKTTLATIRPVMKKMNGEDSLFIRADTFFMAPVNPVKDSIRVVKTIGKGKNKKEVVEMIADTTVATDTAELRYFIGYHHVKIFSDSMQGLCDSIAYSQVDSVMKMMYDPVLWSRRSQITGDTILLYTDSNKLKRMYVPDKAFVVSQTGPDKAELFDQVQGKTLTGYFENNSITEVVVKPNAEAIQFSKDDDGAYIGVSEVSSARMRVLFEDQAITYILFEQDVKEKMNPLDKVNLAGLRLSRFQWLEKKRPKTLKEIFE
ncbi:MAG: LPS export ABC transporter periplasmic protein LptC [Chitinophagales bacterium]|nr:LPS export ABC transporter periplasmic protein LptC [Chitinophagales bacterium]